MAIEPADLLVPAIHIVTLLITATSAIYVYRQKTTEYPQVRNLLVMVHLFYMGVVSFEFARTFVPAPPDGLPVFTNAFLSVYTICNTSFVLADVFLLTLVAVAIYYRPNGKRMIDILREVGKHQTGMTLLGIYTFYILLAEGYLLAVRPFSPKPLLNIVGATGSSPRNSTNSTLPCSLESLQCSSSTHQVCCWQQGGEPPTHRSGGPSQYSPLPG